MNAQSLLILFLGLSFTWTPTSAQPASPPAPDPAAFTVEGVTYDSAIPRPEEIIGHRVGTSHTRPDQVESYFRAVAERSDRVRFETHGATYEGRPLIHAIVTSPANQARLEEILLRNLRLSDTPSEVSDQELQAMPVIAFLGYSIHGNEASGTEAALLLLYHLAAGQGASITNLLDHAVLIINPMLNPDGRNRFVNWVNANRGRVASPDGADREHNEPWPGGRTNHYLFDLNRDWLPAQLKESQGRLALYDQWRPQLQTDHHEMGSTGTFFFQPGIPTRNNPNSPESTLELTRRFGEFHARQLDRLGSLYYSEESYDDFYYGKGSTYPDVNGAVGILFEQASSRALVRDLPGGTLDFAFTVRNHFAASLSSLEAAVQLRMDLLRNQREFYRKAWETTDHDGVRGYAFEASSHPDRSRALVELLLRHGIRVYRAAKAFETPEGVGREPAQTLIVPVQQRQSRLLKTIMERVTTFQDSEFYDVSAWTLPLALDVEVAALKTDVRDLLGPAVTEIPRPQGHLSGTASPYAYLMEWSTLSAPAALLKLQEAGLATRLMTEGAELDVDGRPRHFEPSTIIIPAEQAGRERDAVARAIRRVVEEEGVQVYAVSTGLTAHGPDLGGASTRTLLKPEIALLAGEGTSSSEVGELWFLLNERIGLPVSLIDVDQVRRLDLENYNTLILPGGAYRGLGESEVGRIRDWIDQGGRLITTAGGTHWAIEKQLVKAKLKEVARDTSEVAYGQVRAHRQLETIPGTIFEVRLDTTHPVGFKNGPRMAVMRDHTFYVEPSAEPGVNVALYTDAPLLSGYVSPKNLDLIKGSAALIAYRQGSGAVIAFVDDPAFRAHWLGTSSLLLNAVFFGGSF